MRLSKHSPSADPYQGPASTIEHNLATGSTQPFPNHAPILSRIYRPGSPRVLPSVFKIAFMEPTPDHWSSRTGFILATVGSAVGIGSIWKFPYEVGANGGSAFVVLYLLGLVFIVIPLMLAEFAIGRRGGGDTVSSIAKVAIQHGASHRWTLAGWLGVLTGFLILSFYSVIGGWTIAYAVDTLINGLRGGNVEESRARFESFLASPWQITAYHAAFMIATAAIVARGISHGIEKAMTVLMPVLGALLLALAAYSMLKGDVWATLEFLFRIDLQKFTFNAALEALGLGFFSIGVGMGLMIT